MTPSQSKIRAWSDGGGEAEAETTSEDARRRRRRAEGMLEGGERWLEKARRAGAAALAGVKEAGMKREVEAIGGIGYWNGDREMGRNRREWFESGCLSTSLRVGVSSYRV